VMEGLPAPLLTMMSSKVLYVCGTGGKGAGFTGLAFNSQSADRAQVRNLNKHAASSCIHSSLSPLDAYLGRRLQQGNQHGALQDARKQHEIHPNKPRRHAAAVPHTTQPKVLLWIGVLTLTRWHSARRRLQISKVVAESRPVEICRWVPAAGRAAAPGFNGSTACLARPPRVGCPSAHKPSPPPCTITQRSCQSHLVGEQHVGGPHQHLAARHALALPAADATDHGVALRGDGYRMYMNISPSTGLQPGAAAKKPACQEAGHWASHPEKDSLC
jgi:hypothetical protein